jgi:hypothetical protein
MGAGPSIDRGTLSGITGRLRGQGRSRIQCRDSVIHRSRTVSARRAGPRRIGMSSGRPCWAGATTRTLALRPRRPRRPAAPTRRGTGRRTRFPIYVEAAPWPRMTMRRPNGCWHICRIVRRRRLLRDVGAHRRSGRAEDDLLSHHDFGCPQCWVWTWPEPGASRYAVLAAVRRRGGVGIDWVGGVSGRWIGRPGTDRAVAGAAVWTTMDAAVALIWLD